MKYKKLSFDGDLSKFAKENVILGYQLCLDTLKHYAINGGVHRTMLQLLGSSTKDEEQMAQEFAEVSKETILLLCEMFGKRKEEIVNDLMEVRK